MKIRMILAPGAGGSEMLRMLARSGANTIGVKVVSGVELAKDLLMKAGVSLTEKFLAAGEESSMIFSFLSKVSYFRAASYADAENLAAAIYTMRSLVTEREEEGLAKALEAGEFRDKNDAIMAVYRLYQSLCQAEGRIDRIGIIRKALEIDKNKLADERAASGWKNQQAEYIILKEYPVSPLERALVDFASDGQVQEVSLLDLVAEGVKAKEACSDQNEAGSEAPARSIITEGYGAINEAEDIIDRIYSEGLALDKCQVACANTLKYGQLFYDIAHQYGLPVTFGCGIPIGNSNPARLLKSLYQWDTAGFNGVDGLNKVIFNDAFDRKKLMGVLGFEVDDLRSLKKLTEEAGRLRLSRNHDENSERLDNAADASEAAKILAGELEKGYAHLIWEYSVIRQEPEGKIDQSAVKVISQQLKTCALYAGEDELNSIIPKLLQKTVCSENSRQGCLHITSIKGAMASMRENLFVCGLSSAEFPGAIKENYLLLDSDLEEFGQDRIPASVERIKEKIQNLYNLLGLARGVKSRIMLSYPGYDLSELKDQNPSSVLFEIFEDEHPGESIEDFKDFTRRAEYFQSGISSNRYIGDKYSAGGEFEFKPEKWVLKNPEALLERAWSPSALEVFFQCPRRFYLTRVLGIPEEEADDPFQVLNAADIGTLAHELMEKLGEKSMTLEEFVRMSRLDFDRALSMRPPMHENAAQKARIEFVEMMQTAYQQDPGNEVLSAETEYTSRHPSGVILHGYPDRIERDEEGRYKVIDFKTKRKIEHRQDDIETCLQVVIYAWLCQENGIDISSCEYRYIRKGESVTCQYNEEMRANLGKLMEVFCKAVTEGNYPRVPGDKDENCKYCKMAAICQWPEDQEEQVVSDD